MPVEFTHVPSIQGTLPHYLSAARIDSTTRTAIGRAFRAVVIDGPGGLLTNMDIAAAAARSRSAVGIVLTHWSGVIHPVVAADQIAALDRLSGGRLSLRFLLGPDGQSENDDGEADHVEALAQTDEYLALLKRLWTADGPMDHDGRFYSLRAGFVHAKGPQGPRISIRMSGVSEAAIGLAGRHATVFELAPGSPDEQSEHIRKVEAAAARQGRAGLIGFSLPIRLARYEGLSSEDPRRSFVAGSPTRIEQALRAYATVGIKDFMVSGLDDREAVESFASEMVPLFRRKRGSRARGRDEGLSRSRHVRGAL